MNKKIQNHSFHIPVMGIGYTVDTPIKVAQYGISSVISLVDDVLMEKMREVYSLKFDMPFFSISDKINDFRAKRITAYLNMVNEIVEKKSLEIKNSIKEKSKEYEKYIELLPAFSDIKEKIEDFLNNYDLFKENKNLLNFSTGSIDVNIMTKLDKKNFYKGKDLEDKYNDAHSALRGFANSKLNSSLVLSAGMNTKLYSYLEKFEDFYPKEDNSFKKKIILKVSDYRSALIQGKFLAKKGLWISEYRIESGLNCGGHAFATEGYLMGPILEEFKENKKFLIETNYEIFSKSLKEKKIFVPEKKYCNIRITAQGGVGTNKEHNFLMQHYKLDSIGWGTPFMLVPEAISIDENTCKLLGKSEEKDLYLSEISPLGVLFNNLKNNTKDMEKINNVKKNKIGSVCTNKYLVSNTEFTKKPICTASSKYQILKIKQLKDKNLNAEDYKKSFDKIVNKSCICVGLSTSTLLVNNLNTDKIGKGVSVCPGPNMAYFSEIVSLKKMINHIYGKINLISKNNRPNMFLKELEMYVDYFKNKIEETSHPIAKKQSKYFKKFYKNLNNGIEYYKNKFSDFKENMEKDLEKFKNEIYKENLKI